MNKKVLKKMLSVVLTLSMVLALIPLTRKTAQAETSASVSQGITVYNDLTLTGVTIFGVSSDADFNSSKLTVEVKKGTENSTGVTASIVTSATAGAAYASPDFSYSDGTLNMSIAITASDTAAVGSDYTVDIWYDGDAVAQDVALEEANRAALTTTITTNTITVGTRTVDISDSSTLITYLSNNSLPDGTYTLGSDGNWTYGSSTVAASAISSCFSGTPIAGDKFTYVSGKPYVTVVGTRYFFKDGVDVSNVGSFDYLRGWYYKKDTSDDKHYTELTAFFSDTDAAKIESESNQSGFTKVTCTASVNFTKLYLPTCTLEYGKTTTGKWQVTSCTVNTSLVGNEYTAAELGLTIVSNIALSKGDIINYVGATIQGVTCPSGAATSNEINFSAFSSKMSDGQNCNVAYDSDAHAWYINDSTYCTTYMLNADKSKTYTLHYSASNVAASASYISVIQSTSKSFVYHDSNWYATTDTTYTSALTLSDYGIAVTDTETPFNGDQITFTPASGTTAAKAEYTVVASRLTLTDNSATASATIPSSMAGAYTYDGSKFKNGDTELVLATLNSTYGYALSGVAVTGDKITITAASDGDTDLSTINLTVSLKVPTTSEFTFAAPSALTYDGTAKVATVTSTATAEEIGTITIKYKKGASGTWTTTAPTDAGTYYVAVDVAGGTKYAGATEITDTSWTFKINKEAVTSDDFTFTAPTNYCIGDELPTDIIAKAKDMTGVSITNIYVSSTAGGSFSNSIPTAAGTWYLGIKVNATGNYSSSYVSTCLTDATWCFTAYDPYDITFDANGGTAPTGTIHAYTITGTGTLADSTLSLTTQGKAEYSLLDAATTYTYSDSKWKLDDGGYITHSDFLTFFSGYDGTPESGDTFTITRADVSGEHVIAGNSITSTATREGYTFLGWFTDPENGTQVTTPSASQKVYAHWKDNHVHTYADTWSSDENNHWHAATCSHTTLVSDKAAHTFGAYTSNNDATTAKDGTKTRTCTVCGYKETVTDTGSKIIPEEGTVNVPEDKQDGNFASAGLANTAAEVKATVLTEEDEEAITEGKDINVWLEVKDHNASVTTKDKKAIENKVPNGYEVGAYLDLTLWKQVTGETATKVTETPNGKVTVCITVPKNMQKSGRTYKIVRVHNDIATIINAILGKDYELTFETDQFSTYAIIYDEAAVDNDDQDSSSNDNNQDDSNSNSTSQDVPTGHMSNRYAFVILVFICCVILMGAVMLPKKKEE